MIIRSGLLVFQLLLVWVCAQNEQQEGSGANLIANQEGSGQLELPETETETSDSQFENFEPSNSFYEYLNSGFGFSASIKEAASSSDSWVVEDNDNNIISNDNVIITTDNDIVFVESPQGDNQQNPLNTDDEDYVAEISGNNALDQYEEETNVVVGLTEGDQANIRTIEKVAIENKIEVVTVIPIDSNAHGNALGNTGDGKTKLSPVLSKYGGLSVMLLLGAAVGIGALVSFIGFLACKAKTCNSGKKHNVSASRYPA